MRALIERDGDGGPPRSALSGQANGRHLCVVRRDAGAPLTLDNAMLVTGGESCALMRKRGGATK